MSTSRAFSPGRLISAVPVLAICLLLASCGRVEDAPAAGGQDQPTSEPAPAQAAKPYPLDYCVVSGEKLGGMGEPVVRVYEGQEVKFCCPSCIQKFDADPAKYLAMIKQPAAGTGEAHDDHDHGDE